MNHVARTADHDQCALLLPQVSRTFALSISMLPASLRDAVGVAYLLCRIVDTIEDDAHLALPQRLHLFDLFDTMVADDDSDARMLCGAAPLLDAKPAEVVLMQTSDQVFRVFRGLTHAQRDAVRPWVLEMSRGMRATCERVDRAGALRLRDVSDLEQYCWYVAGTVGELLTGLFADDVGIEAPAVAADKAGQFGLGLQLVNILKDVAEDAERGICFVPTDLLARHQLTVDDLLEPARRVDGLAAVSTLAAVARDHLRAATDYTLAWPADAADVRLFCAVPLALAWHSLDEVERGVDTLVRGKVPKVTRARVTEVLQTAMAVAGDDAALAGWLRGLEPARRQAVHAAK